MNIKDNKQEYKYTKISKGIPFISMALEFKKDPSNFLLKYAIEDGGDLIHFQFGTRGYYLVNNPKLVTDILIKDQKKYTKGQNMQRFKEFIGDGLITSDGDHWRQHRRIIQPCFNKEIVESYYGKIIADIVNETKEKWTHIIENNNDIQVNVTEEMKAVTLKIIMATMFDAKISEDLVNKIDDAVNAIIPFIDLPRVIPIIDKVRYWKKHKKATRALKFMQSIVREMIDDNNKKGNKRNMLSLLLAATDNEGNKLSNKDIEDEIFTMIFAGYESTSLSFQWAFYILSKHPDVASRLREEIELKLDDKSSINEQLEKLDYLDMFVKELLRMYPALWATGRAPKDKVKIAGKIISKRDVLILSPYVFHRNSNYWNNPEGFDPYRFTKEEEDKRERGAYFPFLYGARKCMGANFATLEIKIALILIIKDFNLYIRPGLNMNYIPNITLRTYDDLYANIVKNN